MPLSNTLIYNEMQKPFLPWCGSGSRTGLERRKIMFTVCRHNFPNWLLYNRLYACKLILTIGKIGLHFLGIDRLWGILIEFIQLEFGRRLLLGMNEKLNFRVQ